MRSITLLLVLLLSTTGLFAQHINVSVQGGYIFNASLDPISHSDAYINRGLGVAIQARYQIHKKWEVGPVLEYGAVESLYGLSPTFGIVINRKMQLKKMEFFVGAIGGYLFWQYKDGHALSQQTGYNIGLQAGCDIPLGKLVSLYISAGPRFGRVGSRYGYTQDWTRYEYSTAINLPVMVGVQFHL